MEKGNLLIIIGACLAIGGNLLISISMNIQKYALTRLESQGFSAETSHTYLRSKLWWLGICLMITGEIGNFMAYGFGPATVVAPLGTTTVVANVYIAIVFLGEKLRMRDILGTYLIVIGAFLIVVFSTQINTRLSGPEIIENLKAPVFLIYLCIEVISFIAINWIIHHYGSVHVILFILPAAILASLTVIGSKAVSSMVTLTLSGESQLMYTVFYVMVAVIIASGIAQVRYVTRAMQAFQATVVVPTFFVFFTISAIMAGICFYGEFAGLNFVQVVMFLFGCFCSFLGVFFITQGRSGREEVDSVEHQYQAVLPKKLSPACPFPCTNHLVQPTDDEDSITDNEMLSPVAANDTSPSQVITNGTGKYLFNEQLQMTSLKPRELLHDNITKGDLSHRPSASENQDVTS